MMKQAWSSSGRILCRVVPTVLLFVYLGLFLASAGKAPGEPGTGILNVGEGSDTPTISVTAPEGFTWILGGGKNNETTKIASITVTDYSNNVYLKVHDKNTPTGGVAGHMHSTEESKSLYYPLWVGEKDNPDSMVDLSDELQTIYTFENPPGTVTVYLDFGQVTRYSDPAATDYAITVTFTATATA
jgi:hypothetical protein